MTLRILNNTASVPLQYLPVLSKPPSRTATSGVGILMTISGIALTNIGSFLMKQSRFLKEENQDSANLFHQWRYWFSGLFTYCCGSIIHLIGILLAPANIVATLNSIILDINVVSALILLKKKTSMKETFCTTGAAFGIILCSLISMLAQDNNVIVSGAENIGNPLYFFYFTVCGGCVVLLLCIAFYIEKDMLKKKRETAFSDHLKQTGIELSKLAVSRSIAASTSSSTTDVCENEIVHFYPNQSSPDKESYPFGDKEWLISYPTYIGLCYGAAAGIIGAQGMLQFKEYLIHIKKLVLSYFSQWDSNLFLNIFLGLFFLALQSHFLSLASVSGASTLVVPIYYVFWTFVGALGSFFKFHEFYGYKTTHILLFLFGFVVTLICVAFMVFFEIQSSHQTLFKNQEIENIPYVHWPFIQTWGISFGLKEGLLPLQTSKTSATTFYPSMPTLPSSTSAIRRCKSETKFQHVEERNEQYGKNTLPLWNFPPSDTFRLPLLSPKAQQDLAFNIPEKRNSNHSSGQNFKENAFIKNLYLKDKTIPPEISQLYEKSQAVFPTQSFSCKHKHYKRITSINFCAPHDGMH